MVDLILNGATNGQVVHLAHCFLREEGQCTFAPDNQAPKFIGKLTPYVAMKKRCDRRLFLGLLSSTTMLTAGCAGFLDESDNSPAQSGSTDNETPSPSNDESSTSGSEKPTGEVADTGPSQIEVTNYEFQAAEAAAGGMRDRVVTVTVENVGEQETMRENFIPDVKFWDTNGEQIDDVTPEAFATKGEPLPPSGTVEYEMWYSMDDEVEVQRYEIIVECNRHLADTSPYCGSN